MKLEGQIVLKSGFIFDYAAMLTTEVVSREKIDGMQQKIAAAVQALSLLRTEGKAKGHLSKDGVPEPVFFTRLPFVKEGNPNTDASIQRLKEFAGYLQEEIDAVVFLGVGGSYLGNRVLFEVFAGSGWNMGCEKRREGYPRVYFSGNNLDTDQYSEIIAELEYYAERGLGKGKQFRVLLVPISKSGTTLETVAAFSYFYETCLGISRIRTEVAVVTDLSEGASPLGMLAEEKNWRRFDIKNGIGGRFCVFSDPGLVTAAAIGMDIDAFLAGAGDMEIACRSEQVESNPALLNAVLKYIAAENDVDIEVFMPYAAALKSVGEWYVQLLAESLGKRRDRSGKIVHYGRTPVAAVGSTDMHAQTQQHQDGKKDKIVQFVEISERSQRIILKDPFAQIEAFGKYAGLDIDATLKIALEANAEALTGDGRLNAKYVLPRIDEYYLGQLLYFLMLSVAYEGELADVDAYDQPGVETYKRIMKQKMARA